MKRYTRIPEGIDEFHISFNAGKKSSYEKITGLVFDHTVNNIKRLYDEGEFDKAGCVQVDMLCFDENVDEEESFLALFRSFQGIKYRFSYKYDNQYGSTDHVGRNIQYEKIRQKESCQYVTNTVCIYPNGDVVRCSHDFFGEYTYGNLKESTLFSILSGAKRMDILRKHSEYSFTEICEKCDFNCVDDGTFFAEGYFDETYDRKQRELKGKFEQQLEMHSSELLQVINERKPFVYGASGKRGQAFKRWAQKVGVTIGGEYDKSMGGKIPIETMRQFEIVIAANRIIFMMLREILTDNVDIVNLESYCPF